MNSMPAYYRGGSIIPLKERSRRSTAAMTTDPLTLIIALDKNGNAQGDLYIDDGRSFAFQRGQYAYKKFTFSSKEGVLESTTGILPNMPSVDLTYTSEVVIDRIVVLGLQGGPEGWGARLVDVRGTRVQLSVESGPVSVKEGLPDVAVIVRQPKLAVHNDWRIEFYKTPGGRKNVS